MNIDHCLLLGAGYGTRMGKLGKLLPKPLWPIFNKRIVDLEIAFARKCGCKKIYINSHHLHDKMAHELKDLDITILHEESLLGSGGAIHNFVEKVAPTKGQNLLTINADQFYFFDDKIWESALADIAQFDVILFGLNVPSDAHYNRLVLDKDDKLVNIELNTDRNKELDYLTFSGMSLINLDSLSFVEGKTSFFETVADFKNRRVKVVVPKESSYWDFGTLDLYHQNIIKLNDLLESKEASAMKKFCLEEKVTKVPGFYYSSKKSINLSREEKNIGNLVEGSIYFGDEFEIVSS